MRVTNKYAGSIVIPAYNEEKGIGPLLSEITKTHNGELFEVIVVCNGCSDKTYEIARCHDDATVVNESMPSKTNALNVGDRLATAYPRIYLDADIQIKWSQLRKIVSVMDADPKILACGTRARYDTSHANWLVRKYYDFWQQLPFVSDNSDIGGTGIYALSENGRAKFEKFPDVFADDGFINFHFVNAEKHIEDTVCVTVTTPSDVKNLINIKSRSYAGRLQLKQMFGYKSVRSNSSCSALKVARKNGSNLIGAIVFSVIQVVCRILSKWPLRRTQQNTWLRDESSRN